MESDGFCSLKKLPRCETHPNNDRDTTRPGSSLEPRAGRRIFWNRSLLYRFQHLSLRILKILIVDNDLFGTNLTCSG